MGFRHGALLLAALLLAGCLGGSPGAPPAAEGTRVAWSFTDTAGLVHSDETAEGRPAFLFFMATWCPTCRAKAPMIARVHDAYAAGGLQAFSVGWDPSETPEQLEAWKAQVGHDWPHGVDPSLSVQRAFGVTSQSSLVVVDPGGVVVRSWSYPGPDEPGMRRAIEDAFARRQPAG